MAQNSLITISPVSLGSELEQNKNPKICFRESTQLLSCQSFQAGKVRSIVVTVGQSELCPTKTESQYHSILVLQLGRVGLLTDDND